jgi:hypothetical protein
VNRLVQEAGILDQGSQIIVMWKDLVEEANVHINPGRQLEMEGTNGLISRTAGCAEFIPMQISDVAFEVHAHVVEHAPFQLLLGCPFHHLLLCRLEDQPDGCINVHISDPSDPSHSISVPSHPRKAQVGCLRTLAFSAQTQPAPPSFDISNILDSNDLGAFPQQVLLSPPSSVMAYKKVAKKVHPVLASLPEDFHNIRHIPTDPLLSLPPLSIHPPNFSPGLRLMQERLDDLDLNRYKFLWPEELKLMQHVLWLNKLSLAWEEAEKGQFRDDYFSPVKIPVIEHIPWAHKNIPIPMGILDEVIQMFWEKFAAGVYEHSDASYRSRWFCVKKKSRALCIVHDLQPLNAITIHNSGVPPFTDQLIEGMAGSLCYSMLDLFVGYDHRTLDITSRDLTTIQSPIGTARLTCLPQGWTNAGTIFHEDVTFILEPEIPHVAHPFMDDCSIKGPPSCYKLPDGSPKTLSDNPGIHWFMWEHLNDIHHILHRLLCTGATVLAKKLFIAVSEVIILSHKCTYEGRVPDDSKIAKICDWPLCKNPTDVCAFLGTAGFMHMWIKNYSAIARPLVNLTRKGETFIWEDQHAKAMQDLKDAIISSPALISIDYTSNRPVYLAIDSSWQGIGWILSQDCPDSQCHPARFGSISWDERESRYSQPKVELYGLFHALHALCLHLFGIRNLVIEMDAQFVCGMLNNPDIQPNAAINCWIAAILLFDFKLVHVPAEKHRGPDGLSCREPVEGEDDDEDDLEDWIDKTLALGIWISTPAPEQHPCCSSLSVTAPTQNNADDTFPMCHKSLKADEEVEHIHLYLDSLKHPPNLQGEHLECFL